MTIDNPFDFTGKTVVLAGATGGLGRPITHAFARAGAAIAACARTETALAELSREVGDTTAGMMTAAVDLCVESDVARFVDNVRERFGRIDVLVTLVGGILRRASVDTRLTSTRASTRPDHESDLT